MEKFRASLVIIGAGGHATSVASVALSAGFSVSYFVDRVRHGERKMGAKVVANLSRVSDLKTHAFAIAIGDNAARQRVYTELCRKYGPLKFPVLVHPAAVVAGGSTLGRGSVVMPLAVVGPNSRVGRFCILNTSSVLEHDSQMKSYSSLAPGVVTGGNTKIGLRSAVCIGAVIAHSCSIGKDSVVGANSFVKHDVRAEVLAFGNPAAVIRPRMVGEPYLD